MTAPDFRAVLDELLSRSDWTRGDMGLSDDELLEFVGLANLSPSMKSDISFTVTAHDGDQSEARLRIEYEPPQD